MNMIWLNERSKVATKVELIAFYFLTNMQSDKFGPSSCSSPVNKAVCLSVVSLSFWLFFENSNMEWSSHFFWICQLQRHTKPGPERSDIILVRETLTKLDTERDKSRWIIIKRLVLVTVPNKTSINSVMVLIRHYTVSVYTKIKNLKWK